MKITLHQLQVFAKVAELGSVTQAARALHMTQPAVSNIIKHLESQLQASLTSISNRQLHLTDAGRLLLQGCAGIRHALDQTVRKINALKGEVAGQLRVASVSTAKYFVPHVLSDFKRQYPDVQIALKVKNREQIIKRLDDNLDDFVVMSQPPLGQNIERWPFYQDELVVAASAEHELAKQRKLTMKQLAAESWLIREEGSGTRIAMLKLLRKHRLSPVFSLEIDNNESIKQAIIANMGISILSKHSIELELKHGLLKVLPVAGFPVSYDWYLVKHRYKALSLVAQTFYHCVRQPA